jgi:hypothetical protein
MRYIYGILLILIALSAVIGYTLFPSRISPHDVSLKINDRVITTDEFNRLYSSRPRGIQDKKDFLNSLITKELLIQESQREGIDKEERFRRSMQNFYEESLIKLLMDEKLASVRFSVGDEEIDAYVNMSGRKLFLTMFSFVDADEAKKSDYKGGETMVVFFENLACEIRNAISGLKQGEKTGPIRSGERYIVIRLDRVESPASRVPLPADREKIKEMLTEEKKEQMINDWVAGLREKASIKISTGVESQGGK